MSAAAERRFNVADAARYLKMTPNALRKRDRRRRRRRKRTGGVSGFRVERHGKAPCVVFISEAWFPGGKEVEWLRTRVAAERLGCKRNTLTKRLNESSEKDADGMIIARLPGMIAIKVGREWRVCLEIPEAMRA